MRRTRAAAHEQTDEPVLPLLLRFWPHTRGLRHWIVACAVLASIPPIVAAAEVWLFKTLVDDALVPKDLGLLPLLAGLYMGLNLASGAVEFTLRMVSAWAGEQFVLRLRNHVFDHLLRLSPLQVARRPQGDTLTRLSGDVGAVERILVSGPAEVVEMAVRILVFVGIMVWLDPLLAALALVATPLFWVLARRFSAAIRRAARERRRRSGLVQSLADEVLTSMAAVQAASAEDRERRRYRHQGEAAVAAEMQATRLIAFFRPLVDLVELTGALLVVTAGAWSLASGRLTLGELLAFMTYLTQLYSPIRGITDLITAAYKAGASAERLEELLDEAPAVTEAATPVTPELIVGRVEFENVGFRYPASSRPAVDGVSFFAEPGTVTAVVGPSGSGKTTMAWLLLRLADPDTGTVRLDGHDVRTLSLRTVRSSVQLLLQDTHLFDGTIEDNVRYGRPDASAADVLRALDDADASDVVARWPEGIGHHVGPKGRFLSGGQRRRFALARALLAGAPVLVLDEYSTGLDPQSSRRVLNRLRDPRRTVVVITHDPAVAQAADHVLVVDQGHVVEQGVPSVLLLRDSRYARLVEAVPHETAEVART